jgi:pimeloyl-ACP methyl ester carboxylesterase
MQHFVTDDSETIHIAVSGSGPSLILLHEWASNHRVWKPIVKELEAQFTIYRWDARGHGNYTATGAHQPALARMAKDLAGLIDHFGLQRSVLVGHSMGVLVAWEYMATSGCGRVAGLCVVDQSPRLITDDDWRFGIYYDWPAERDAEFVAEMRRDFVEAVVRLIAYGRNEEARARFEDPADGLWRLRAYMASVEPEPLIAIWQSLTAADLRPALPCFGVPALLVYGSKSNFYGVETGEYVQRALPNAKLVVYEGADHSPHLAEPKRFASDLAGFASAL